MSKKILEFENFINNNEINKIRFDKIIGSDAYLKLTAINALEKNGYNINSDGLIQFQEDSNLKHTGILGVAEFSILIQAFDNDTIQEIYNNLNGVTKKIKKNNRKEKIGDIMMTIFVIFTFCMTSYGFVTLVKNIAIFIFSKF